ncbi:MAG: MarR family winged helix-turn-helix transcriptional regulator [Hyphomicrobiales bacterium]
MSDTPTIARAPKADGKPTRTGLRSVMGFGVRRLHGLFVAGWARHFRGLGIDVTPMQGGALLLLEENPGISQNALARLLGIEPPTLAQTLNPLVEAGYVQRYDAPRDRRAVALHLTRSGRDLTRAIQSELPDHEADILSVLPEEDRATLLRLIDRAVDGHNADRRNDPS